MIVPSRLCLIYTGCQIKARINFKILTTIFNCGTGRAPTYLIELSSVNRRQGIRSASDHGMNYDVPFNKKTWFNDRSFFTIGQKIWNNLPLYIKQSVSIDIFLAFDFCRFCVVIRFFPSPPQRPMTSDFEGFIYQILSITLFSYLNS